jgi:hypothetical protein
MIPPDTKAAKLHKELRVEYSAVEDARRGGFADAEELIAGMLERMAGAQEARGEEAQSLKGIYGQRAQVLREAALAVRLGQHRDEPEVRP